jgi:hypothetical protein
MSRSTIVVKLGGGNWVYCLVDAATEPSFYVQKDFLQGRGMTELCLEPNRFYRAKVDGEEYFLYVSYDDSLIELGKKAWWREVFARYTRGAKWLTASQDEKLWEGCMSGPHRDCRLPSERLTSCRSSALRKARSRRPALSIKLRKRQAISFFDRQGLRQMGASRALSAARSFANRRLNVREV